MISDRKLTFYHSAPSRGNIVHWMLQELGIEFDVKMIDIRNGEGQTPEFLALNPLGKVPTIVHGDTVVTEAAAICCYLADMFPAAGLAPALDDPMRGEYLRWLFFSPSTIEPALIDRVRKQEAGDRSMSPYRDWDTLMAMLRDVIGNAQPWILGEKFTTVDVVMGSAIRYGRMFDILPETPVFEDYIRRINLRPAYVRMQEIDAPYVEASMAV